MQPAPWNPYQDKAQQASRQSRHTPQTPLSPGSGPQTMSSLNAPPSQNPYVQAAAANNLAAREQQQPISMHSPRGDRDGDIAMEDADPYKPKHASLMPTMSARASHQRMSSNVNEESSAARRYSPMNLTPASPMSSQQPTGVGYVSYTPQGTSARASPTRQSFVPSSPAYYNSPPTSRPNAPQLPPIQSTMNSSYNAQAAALTLSPFARDLNSVTSPRQSQVAPPMQVPKGPVPKFAAVSNIAELKPRINNQPPFRRAKPEGGFLSPLQALTTQLPATYRICNPNFKYESSRNPRRVLTKPSKGLKNDGYDNEDSDYILYVNDILGSEDSGHKNRYLILDVLGQGTFGQVVKCQNLRTQEVVAVKVVKNRTAYFNQSMMEVSVLDLLNKQMDKNDDHHLLRLKDTFIHRQHLCLVFELLSVNLYELIKQNQFRGLSTTLVRVFAQQLLTGLSLLSKAKLIHCDLKPENILLKNLESPIIKIIDFGSACDERQTVYTYIQSRFYRSPEVLLGLPYSAAIDMWSLGCIVVELFLGLPLFPGSSEYNQVSRITEMLGLAPTWMLEMGKQSSEFFEKAQDDFRRRAFRLKSMEQYAREHGTKEAPSKKYFNATTLPEIIKTYPMPRKNMKQHEVDREMANRQAFIDFAQGLLNLNPLERWTPAQAKLHPFITQQKFTGPFVPPMTLRSGSSKSPAPGVQEQQRAEAMSKQRAQAQAHQAAAVQVQVQNAMHAQQNYVMAAAAAQSPMVAQGGGGGMLYAQQQQQQQPAGSMYTPQQMQVPTQAPPGYAQSAAYGHGHHQQQQSAYHAQPQNLNHLLPNAAGAQQQQQQRYQPAGTQQTPGSMYQAASQQQQPQSSSSSRSSRQRASTAEQSHQSGIPASLQRVMGHLDPNAPIRLQPSPAYYPPPLDGSDAAGNSGHRRRGSRTAGGGSGRGGGQGAGANRDFIRNLEDGAMGEGWAGGGGWH